MAVDLLAGRAARLALLLVGVAVACFGLMEVSPVDPVDAYVGAEVARIGPERPRRTTSPPRSGWATTAGGWRAGTSSGT